jgi:hypothetical protein
MLSAEFEFLDQFPGCARLPKAIVYADRTGNDGQMGELFLAVLAGCTMLSSLARKVSRN